MSSSEWTEEQRRAAAADLCERAAAALRRGDPVGVDHALVEATELVLEPGQGRQAYRFGLRALRRAALESVAVEDAAIAAVEAGKHPPDSLPGKLEAHRASALEEYADLGIEACCGDDKATVYEVVMGWVGVVSEKEEEDR